MRVLNIVSTVVSIFLTILFGGWLGIAILVALLILSSLRSGQQMSQPISYIDNSIHIGSIDRMTHIGSISNTNYGDSERHTPEYFQAGSYTKFLE